MLTKYNGETVRWVYGLAFFLVVIGLSRFLEFPPNFTPIIAGAVFLPFICRGITFSLLPVLVMLITDVFLGFHEVMLFTYGAILLIGLFAQSVQWSLGVKALVGVLVWHLVVNFGVYLNSEPTRTLSDVYVSAWPFDFRLLVSTLLFSGLFWSIKALIERNAVANFADQ